MGHISSLLNQCIIENQLTLSQFIGALVEKIVKMWPGQSRVAFMILQDSDNRYARQHVKVSSLPKMGNFIQGLTASDRPYECEHQM